MERQTQSSGGHSLDIVDRPCEDRPVVASGSARSASSPAREYLKNVRSKRRYMPTFELNLSDDVYAEFQQLADQEFVSEEQAAEDLIASGIEAYNVSVVDDDPRDEMLDGAENNMFDTAEDPGSLEDDRL